MIQLQDIAKSNISFDSTVQLQGRNESMSRSIKYNSSEFKDIFSNLNKSNQGLSDSFDFNKINKYVNHKKPQNLNSDKKFMSGSTNVDRKDRRKESEEVEDKKNSVAEEMINILSQFFKLEKQQLEEISSMLGMDMGDLLESSKINPFIGELATISGLSEEQAKALSEALQNINIQSEQPIPKVAENKAISSNTAELGATEPVVDIFSDVDQNFQNALEQLQLMLKELLSKNSIVINKNMDNLKEEVSKTDTEAKTTSIIDDSYKAISEPLNEVFEDQKTENSNSKSFHEERVETNKSNISQSSSENMLVLKNSLKTQENSDDLIIDENAFVNIDTLNSGLKSNPVDDSKITVEIPKQEIFNQILDKAKINLNGDKSEIAIKLKPESLGNINLKVITEHGIVIAKFVTENQQVKEIIEANMQLLKDVLQKQGLSVEGFSVSVRQDSSSQLGWANEGSKQRKQTKENISEISSNSAVYGHSIFDKQRINAYDWTESKINLTA